MSNTVRQFIDFVVKSFCIRKDKSVTLAGSERAFWAYCRTTFLDAVAAWKYAATLEL